MDRLTAMTEAFVDFGIRYPAFVDCAQALMRRTGPELLEEIAESAMLRLGRAMTACLNQIGKVLDDGMAPPKDLAGGPRIGIRVATEHPWRWSVPGSRYVSGPASRA